MRKVNPEGTRIHLSLFLSINFAINARPSIFLVQKNRGKLKLALKNPIDFRFV